MQSNGLKGVLTLQQISPFAATQVTLHWDIKLEGLGGLRIHALPPLPDIGRNRERKACQGIGAVYNPTNKPIAAEAPLSGELSTISACLEIWLLIIVKYFMCL